MSEAEYLLFDLEHVGEKHEFVNGEVLAMSGAHPAHSFLAARIVLALGNRLRGRPCTVHASDLRVQVSETGMYAYPDVVIACGTPRFAPTRPPSLTNPRVVIEILSPTTADYDRGAKFAHYQRIAEMQEYVLVGCPERRVEHYLRLPTGQWLLTEIGTGEVPISACAITIPLDEIYERTGVGETGEGGEAR